MSEIIKQKLSLFQSLNSSPSRAVGMEEIIRLIQYDSDVQNKTESYRRIASVLGKEKADEEVKRRIVPACSIGVLFDGNGRGAANVLGFTGLALCDIDKLDDVDGALARVKADAHALLAYKTISGQGLRAIYRYTVGGRASKPDGSNDDDCEFAALESRAPTATSWPAAFLKGNRYFAELVGHEYDPQCTDYSRLCGLAHDPDVYVNWEAMPFVITDEEILAANFSPERERGKARKEYAAGTHTANVDDAWPKVEQALQRRGLVYQSGHHHDYVMHAAFLMNRYGVDLEELLGWAAQAWSDYNTQEREATIRSCYRKTQEHGTWRLNRQGRKSKETSMITLPEIREWLRQHVEVIYNVVTDISMWRSHPSPPKGRDVQILPSASLGNQTSPPLEGLGEAWQQLDERVVCSMRSQMAADRGKRVLKSDVMDVLRSDFARLYHPVREYIEALPAWDGRDRVKELCAHLTAEAVQDGQTEQQAQELLLWALHKWLVASLATWMSDLASNHEIFVLIGSQGIYKTTFFRHLLPPQLRMYFWENAHNSFSSKDDHLALSENCLVEIEEIDLQNPRDISELKALATSEKVKERRPYARFREEKHRLASFCGSGNQQRFLSDDTGNRRWLCHKVTHIDDPRTWGIDYDQLYAQLRDELRRGFRYWFDPQEQRIVERQNQAFRIESDEEQLIRTRLRPPHTDEKITLMNAASICQFINGGVVGRGLSTRKVGIVMGKMGFKKVHTRSGWFYECYQIPVNDIQDNLSIPDENDDEATPFDPQFREGYLPF